MSAIDFATLKKQVRIEEVAAQLLGLKLSAGRQKVKSEGGQETEVDVLRGPCPIKRTDGARDFVITPVKQVWYSFKAKKGGDVLALVSAVRECSIREAADLISKDAGVTAEKPKEKSSDKSFDPDRYIQGLKPDHEALAPFNLSPETLKEWRGGYSSSGQNKGRLALPIVGTQGIAGFMGVAPDRSIVFPDDIDPRLYIFGMNLISEGIVHVVPHPVDVLDLYQNTGEMAVAFLTETIFPDQLRYLITLIGSQDIKFVL